jgi:hypothetical protein
MKLIYGEMFHPATYTDENKKPIFLKPNAICITVNSFIKKDGSAVMGRGCAKLANDRWPWVAVLWGKLAKNGAGVSVLCEVSDPAFKTLDLIAFPVKDSTEVCEDDKSNIVKHMRAQFNPGDDVPGWACKARLDLIKKSLIELVAIADAYEYETVILPRPGIGFGELPWADVLALLSVLDDRFFVISNNA